MVRVAWAAGVLMWGVSCVAECAQSDRGTKVADVFPLVRGGRPEAVLVSTGDKTVDADIAFFTNAVFQCTGAHMPVVAARGQGVRAMTFAVERRGVFLEDDFSVSFPDADTLLVRGTSVSCRWALNRILERDFGCVFCFPGPDGTHYPQRSDVAITREGFAGTASMRAERHMYREDPDWERCLGGRQLAEPGMFYGHMLWRILAPKRFRNTPLWEKIMPKLADGSVRAVGDEEHHTWQPCLASQESVDEAVKFINTYFDERPAQRVFSLSVNDMEGYCVCEACRSLNGGFGKKSRFGRYDSHSESYYSWANKVAEGVAARHPGVALGLLAYCGTIDPPSFRLHPSIVPFLCTSVHQMMDDGVAREREELFRAWRDKASHVGNWGYDYGALQYAVPRIYLSCQKKFFDLKKVNPGFDAYFGEGSFFIGEGPKRYMFYRRMFGGDIDDDAEYSRWLDACCGPAAAPHLRAYYKEWEDFWTGESVRKTGWYGGVRGVYFIFHNHSYMWGFDKAVHDRASAHLEKAVAAAEASGDAGQRARARRIAEFHRFYSARMRLFGMGHRPSGGPEGAIRFFDDLPALSAAAKEAADAADRIVAELGYPKAYKPFPGNERQLRVFKERAHTPVNQNMLQLLNCAVRQVESSPEVKAAAERAAGNPATLREIRERLSTLVAVARLPNIADGVQPKKDVKSWTWDFPSLTENRQFYCTFRVTNRRVGRQSLWMHFAGWNPKYLKWRGHDEVMQSLAPGETATISFFCKTISGAKGARLTIVPLPSAFASSEDISVSDLRLCEVETAVKQIWPD